MKTLRVSLPLIILLNIVAIGRSQEPQRLLETSRGRESVYIFLTMMKSLSNEFSEPNDANTAVSVESAGRSMFGATLPEFEHVLHESITATNRVTALTADYSDYAKKQHSLGRSPDPERYDAYYADRTKVFAESLNEIHRSVSPATWSAIVDFISEIRTNVKHQTLQ